MAEAVYEFKTDIEPEEFDSFTEGFTQNSNWARVKSNWEAFRTGLYRDGSLVAAGLVLSRTLPMGYKLYYIPRGPIGEWKSEDMKVYFEKLKEMAKKDKALFIKFDPMVIYRKWFFSDEKPEEADDSVVAWLTDEVGAKHMGYTMAMNETIQPRVTMGVDLTGDFRKRYHRNTKRALKSAEKYGVQIEEVHRDSENLEQALDDFMKVIGATEETKGIALRNRDYFETMMKAYPGSVLYIGKVDLAAAEKQIQDAIDQKKYKNDQELKKLNTDLGKIQEMRSFGEDLPVITGLLEIDSGNRAELLYMGNDRRYSMFGATQKAYDTSYARAKENGLEYADMSGVEGTLDDGLAKAKGAYGSQVRELIGEFDLPVSKSLYPMASAAYQKLKVKFS